MHDASRIWIPALTFACGVALGGAGMWLAVSKETDALVPSGASSMGGLESGNPPPRRTQSGDPPGEGIPVVRGPGEPPADLPGVGPSDGEGSETPPAGEEKPRSGSPRERLFDSIARGDFEGVKSALADGADPESPLDGKSALLEAIRSRKTDIALLLLARGAPVDRAGPSGFTPLMRAVIAFEEEVLKALLERGADVRARNRGWTALAFAEAQGAEKMAEALRNVGAGLDPEMRARCRLLEACATGDLGLALAALDGGAPAAATDYWGTPALCHGAGGQHHGVVRLLLERGAPANPPGDVSQPLAESVHSWREEGRLETVRLLLDAGANPNAFGRIFSPDQTPLHMAASRGLVDEARLMLAHGGDPNRLDERGDSALHLAVDENEISTAELLLRKGADPNLRDGRNRSPLEIARGREDMESLLIRHGAR